MSEGKTSKYLKYAIGEILLVVIGILIALQINNWNENRKTEAFENKLRTELIQSLQTDIDGLQFVKQQNKEIHDQGLFIIELIEGKHSYHDSLNPIFYSAHTYYHHSFNRSAYETAKEHGLYFIKDDEARVMLSQLYEWQYEQNANHRTLINNFNATTVEPFMADNFEFILNDQKGYIPLDHESVLSNPKYKFIVTSSMNKIRVAMYWQGKFLDNIKKIQAQLKSEVK